MKSPDTVTRKPRIGAPSHHKQARVVPIRPVTAVPAAPEGLSEAAAVEWARVWPALAVIGLAPVLDQSVVRAYAESVADLRAARAEWEATGASLTVQRPSGPRESPDVPLIRALAGDVAKFAGLIGLTPKARRALGLELGAVVEAPKRGSGRDPAASTSTIDRFTLFAEDEEDHGRSRVRDPP